MWESKIYPGMKQCLIGAMLACQDTMDKRQNSFELYGADFMLTDDFTPWLIEINSSPDLAPTTSVTARLCPQCLEDVVKGNLEQYETLLLLRLNYFYLLKFICHCYFLFSGTRSTF